VPWQSSYCLTFSSTICDNEGKSLSYAASVADDMRRTAVYVVQIIKGANPRDLPVEQPTKFELVINLKTAKAIGITIPRSVLLQADEVIQ